MLHKTRGIVLRTVKYGETSVVTTLLTELFGIQSYLVNGARSSKSKSTKAVLLQPANILDLVVYHQEQKHLQRISELKFAYLYKSMYTSVIKNTVALYIVELLQKAIKQPEYNPELYYFSEQILQSLDENPSQVANLPIYFTLKLGEKLGFGLNGRYSEHTPYIDLQEGLFVDILPHHPHFLDPASSKITDQLLHLQTINELGMLSLNKARRSSLLSAYLNYFRLHLPDFGEMKSPPILHEILD